MLKRVGDWHGEQAVKAYRGRHYKAFRRHIQIAERLWSAA